MKSKLIIISLIFLFSGVTAEAQFLKRLKNKVLKTVERKVTDKAADKAEQALDSILNKPDKNVGTEDSTEESVEETKDSKKKTGILDMIFNSEGESQNTNADTQANDMIGDIHPAPADNNVKLPESYNFSYQATMQVTNSQGTVKTEYYLEPEESYYAKKQANSNFTEYVVYDNQRSMEIYFAELKGEKKKARKKMNLFTKAKMVGAYRDAPNRTVKKLGNKTLLGYTCNGYEISTDAGTTQLWVTNEAPATMYSAFFEKRVDAQNSPFTKNSMILEMSFTSSDEPKKSYQMTFTQLHPNTLVFSDNEYKK